MKATPILHGFDSMDAYLFSTISDEEGAQFEEMPCQCSRCGLSATARQMGRICPTSGKHLCLSCRDSVRTPTV